MGRRTGANIVRNNMHKVNRQHSDKEIARSMLRNHELTAQQFYLEKNLKQVAKKLLMLSASLMIAWD